MEILECVIRYKNKNKTKASVYILKPSVSVDNTLLDLHNFSGDTRTLNIITGIHMYIYCQ